MCLRLPRTRREVAGQPDHLWLICWEVETPLIVGVKIYRWP